MHTITLVDMNLSDDKRESTRHIDDNENVKSDTLVRERRRPHLSDRSRCVRMVGENIDAVVDHLRRSHDLSRILSEWIMRSGDTDTIQTLLAHGTAPHPPLPPSFSLSRPLLLGGSHVKRKDHTYRPCLPTELWVHDVFPFLTYGDFVGKMMRVSRYFLDTVRYASMVCLSHTRTYTHTCRHSCVLCVHRVDIVRSNYL